MTDSALPHDDPSYWDGLVTDAMAQPVSVVVAHTFIQSWGTASQPVLVSCDDGEDWVVKGPQTGKQAVTDQVLGLLGHITGCPVPKIGQVELTAELIAAEPQLQHIPPGRAHGSKYSSGYSDRQWLGHAIPENFLRFAHLAAFYGWGLAGDYQLIYRIKAPQLVLSVDHGHFIDGAAQWTTETVAAAPLHAELDAQIAAHCPPSTQDLKNVCDDLDEMTDTVIARAVGAPPAHWHITMAERTALAALFAKRRDYLRTRIRELI